MDIITALLVIAVTVLNIILFFKVWGMTNDVEEITRILRDISKTFATTYIHGSSAPVQAADTPAPKKVIEEIEEIDDPEIANTIIVRFDNGTVGRLKTYPGYPQHSVITKDGFELLYANKDAARNALLEYILHGTESKVFLQDKRRWSESQKLSDKYWR